jgi:hypothetical protein
MQENFLSFAWCIHVAGFSAPLLSIVSREKGQEFLMVDCLLIC